MYEFTKKRCHTLYHLEACIVNSKGGGAMLTVKFETGEI